MQRVLRAWYFRVAWTAASVLVCLLLLFLWIRSYVQVDSIMRGTPSAGGIVVDSLSTNQSTLTFSRHVAPIDEQAYSVLTEKWSYYTTTPKYHVRLFWWRKNEDDLIIRFPLWLPAAFCAAVAVLPWVKSSSRFSLKFLFIAMTALATALLLIIWLSCR
jgi:hypothetical protein